MSTAPRKKSPRAPSMPLDAAIDRALTIYDKEGRHAAQLDVLANDLGYKGANNGAFMATLATLRYYGLIERPKEGYGAVSKDVETYKYAPEEEMRQELRIKWLKYPEVFSELLQQYHDRLPSDASLKMELIRRGFIPKAADDCVAVFRKSVDFARFYEVGLTQKREAATVEEEEELEAGEGKKAGEEREEAARELIKPDERKDSGEMDRIPVRLAGGRKAWLEIPVPFYETDKKRLIAQIELILTDDDEDEEN